jgi:hypothetical protein
VAIPAAGTQSRVDPVDRPEHIEAGA